MFIKILIVEKNPGKLRSKAVSFKREKSQPTPPSPKQGDDLHLYVIYSSVGRVSDS